MKSFKETRAQRIGSGVQSEQKMSFKETRAKRTGTTYTAPKPAEAPLSTSKTTATVPSSYTESGYRRRQNVPAASPIAEKPAEPSFFDRIYGEDGALGAKARQRAADAKAIRDIQDKYMREILVSSSEVPADKVLDDPFAAYKVYRGGKAYDDYFRATRSPGELISEADKAVSGKEYHGIYDSAEDASRAYRNAAYGKMSIDELEKLKKTRSGFVSESGRNASDFVNDVIDYAAVPSSAADAKDQKRNYLIDNAAMYGTDTETVKRVLDHVDRGGDPYEAESFIASSIGANSDSENGVIDAFIRQKRADIKDAEWEDANGEYTARAEDAWNRSGEGFSLPGNGRLGGKWADVTLENRKKKTDYREYLKNALNDETREIVNGDIPEQVLSTEDAVSYAFNKLRKPESVRFTGADYRGVILKEMDDNQLATLITVYNEDGKEAADEYIDHMKYGVDKKITERALGNISEAAKEHPVLLSALSVPWNTLGGVAGLPAQIKALFGGDVSQYDLSLLLSNASQKAREVTSEDMSGVGSFFYQTGMSMADCIFNMAVAYALTPGAGTGITEGMSTFEKIKAGVGDAGTTMNLIMSSSAASSTFTEKLSEGYTTTQSAMLAGLSGFAEYITEKKSIETFLEAKGWLQSVLYSMAAEGSEEFNSDVINSAGAKLLVGESEIEKQTAELMASGMSEKEAFNKAFVDWWAQAGLDTLGGAISGLGFSFLSGGRIALEKADAVRKARKYTVPAAKDIVTQGPQAIDYAVNEGLKYGPDTSAGRYAAKIAAQSEESGEYANRRQIARLLTKEMTDASPRVEIDTQVKEDTDSSLPTFSRNDNGEALVRIGNEYVGKDNITFANLDPAVREVYAEAVTMTDENGKFDKARANAYAAAYDGSEPAAYREAFDAAYEAGREGVTFKEYQMGASPDVSARAQLEAWAAGQKIRNSEFGIRNSEAERAESQESGAESQEPGAESQEPGAESVQTAAAPVQRNVSVGSETDTFVRRGDDVAVRMDDGSVVPMSEIELDEIPQGMRKAYAVASRYKTADGSVDIDKANAYLSGYDGSSLGEYTAKFEHSYENSEFGIRNSEAVKTESRDPGVEATEAIPQSAEPTVPFTQGSRESANINESVNDINDNVNYDSVIEAENSANIAENEKAPGAERARRATFDDFQHQRVIKRQNGSVTDQSGTLTKDDLFVIGAVADKFGLDINILNKMDDGSWGEFVRIMHQINLSSKSDLFSSFMHELGHVIEFWAPEKFAGIKYGFRDFIIQKYGMRTMSDLLDDVKARYGNISDDAALVELACDQLEVVRDVESFAEEVAENLSKAGYTQSKIRQFLRDIADFLKRAADVIRSWAKGKDGKGGAKTAAGVYAERDAAYCKQLAEKFLDAADTAAENYKAHANGTSSDVGIRNSEANGEVKKMIVSSDGTKYSARFDHDLEFRDIVPASEEESKNLAMSDKRNIARFSLEVDNTINNKYASNKLILVGKPSEILQKYLKSDKLIYIPQNIIKKSVLSSIDKSGKHGLGKYAIIDMLYQLSDPVMITGNTTEHQKLNDNSIVVWMNWVTDNKDSVIVPIRIDTSGNIGTYNNINSMFDVYDKDYENDLLRDGNILYTKNNEDVTTILTQRRDMPKRESSKSSFDNSISQNGDLSTPDSQKMRPQEQSEVDELRRQLETERAERADYEKKTRAVIRDQKKLINALRSERVDGRAVVSFDSTKNVIRDLNSRYGTRLSLSDDTAELTKLYSQIAVAGNVSSDDVIDHLRGFAKKIIDASYHEDTKFRDEHKGILRDWRENAIRLNRDQVSVLEHKYGSWAEARKHFFGKVNFSQNSGTYLDDNFREWLTEYPELFPGYDEGLTAGDQPIALLNAYDLTRPETVSELMNEFGGDAELAENYLAAELFDQYWKVDEVKTAAKARAEAIGETEARYEAAMLEYREAAQKQIKALEGKVAEKEEDFDKYRAREEKEKMRKKIKDQLKWFKTRALTPNSQAHVPSEMYDSLITVCDAVDLTHNYDTQLGKKIAILKGKYDAILRAGGEQGDTLGADAKKYGMTPEELYDLKCEFDDGISGELQRLGELFEDKSVAELKTEELRDLHDVLETIKERFNHVGEILGDAEKRTFAESRQSFEQQQKRFEQSPLKLGRFMQDMTSPLRAVKYLEGHDAEGELTKYFDALEKGTFKEYELKMDMMKPFDELRSGKNKAKYDRFAHELIDSGLVDEHGNPVKLTHADIVTIIMTAERERASGGYTAHLQEGGITIPDRELMKKGKPEKAKTRSQRVRHVTMSDIASLAEKLDNYDREWIAASENLFNKVSPKILNDVMLVIKYKRFIQTGYYIPFVTDKNFLVSNIDALKFDARLKEAGYMKEVTPGANAPLTLLGIDDLVSRHADNVATQGGLAVPLYNLNRFYNGPVGDTSIKRIVQTNFGTGGHGAGANNIIEQAMTDLQKHRGGDQTWVDSLVSNYVSAVLTFNPSVTLKQMASYEAAGIHLSQRALGERFSMFGKSAVRFKKICDEIDAHTGLHYMRRIGLSSAEIAQMTAHYGVIDKAIDKMHLPEGINPKKWIQFTDCLTTAALWEATKKQIGMNYAAADKAGEAHAEIGSEEYWNDVTALYERVISDTQPMYDVLHRPEFSKKDNKLFKVMNMFKTVPFQNLGILADSAGEMAAMKQAQETVMNDKNATEEEKKTARENAKAAKRKFGRAVRTQTFGIISFGLMTAAVALGLHREKDYHDEYGDLTFESVLNGLAWNLGEGIWSNTLPFVPANGVNLVRSGFKFDAISETPAGEIVNELITDLTKGYKQISDTFADKSLTLKEQINTAFGRNSYFLRFVTTAGDAAGFPAANAKKLTESIYNIITDPKYIGGERKKKQLMQKLYDGRVEGDEKKAGDAYSAARKQYNNADIDTGIAALLMENHTIESMAKAYADGDWDSYDKDYDKLYDMGFSDVQILKARNKYLKSLEPDEEYDLDKESSDVMEVSYERAAQAVVDGDIDTIERAVRDYADKGKSDSSIKSGIKDKLKETYALSDEKERKKMRELLIEYFGFGEKTQWEKWENPYSYDDLYSAITSGSGDVAKTAFDSLAAAEAEGDKGKEKAREKIAEKLKPLYKNSNGSERLAMQDFLKKNCGFPAGYNFNAWLNAK